MAAMLAVLKARWLANGWKPPDEAEGRAIAETFIADFDRAGVHWRFYMTLYHRFASMRANQIATGRKPIDFSSDAMLACWPSLRDEQHDKMVKEKRTLPPPSYCPRCELDMGMERVFDANGKSLGIRPGPCAHLPLVPGEWLWKKQEGGK